ncbi:LAETG motif-containing sortase-dependent surface protein [Streptomyces sp. MST-110588]|uniref:LAETG motif-containing sortase-dependent surface protein n=1 Tax=Streptomyces sp. MST-110588 TaxID=2833628 RepID=UPI003242B9B8
MVRPLRERHRRALLGHRAHRPGRRHPPRRTAPRGQESDSRTEQPADVKDTAAPGALLADTGSVDTTPYVVGGAACLGVGAGLVGFSLRRRNGGASEVF